MSDITSNQAEAYAARHRLRLAERLGFGIHGTVYVVEYESKEGASASARLAFQPFAGCGYFLDIHP